MEDIGNRRTEKVIIVRECYISSQNYYRTKWVVFALDGSRYYITILHKKGARNRTVPMVKIGAGDMLVICRDRHTGARWVVKE